MTIYGRVLLCLVAIGLAGIAEARDGFVSERLTGLLTKEEDNNLSKQALMGVASANTMKSFVTNEGARNCTSLFNSYLTLTDYPLTEAQGSKYAGLVTAALESSRNYKYVEAPQADTQACGIFTAFSAVSAKKNQKIYELIVYLFDWQRARTSGLKGLDGFRQGSVVAFVSRQMVESREKPSKQELGDHSFPLFESMLKATLNRMHVTD